MQTDALTLAATAAAGWARTTFGQVTPDRSMAHLKHRLLHVEWTHAEGRTWVDVSEPLTFEVLAQEDEK